MNIVCGFVEYNCRREENRKTQDKELGNDKELYTSRIVWKKNKEANDNELIKRLSESIKMTIFLEERRGYGRKKKSEDMYLKGEREKDRRQINHSINRLNHSTNCSPVHFFSRSKLQKGFQSACSCSLTATGVSPFFVPSWTMPPTPPSPLASDDISSLTFSSSSL